MKAHTPGPWSVPHFAEPGTNCECGYVLTDQCMGAVATVHCSGKGKDWRKHGDNPRFEEACANARLIAAAPALLAEHTAACDAADAILAIMTGEFGRLMVEGPDEEIEITMCGHTVRIPAHKFNRLYNATTRAAISKASTP